MIKTWIKNYLSIHTESDPLKKLIAMLVPWENLLYIKWYKYQIWLFIKSILNNRYLLIILDSNWWGERWYVSFDR